MARTAMSRRRKRSSRRRRPRAESPSSCIEEQTEAHLEALHLAQCLDRAASAGFSAEVYAWGANALKSYRDRHGEPASVPSHQMSALPLAPCWYLDARLDLIVGYYTKPENLDADPYNFEPKHDQFYEVAVLRPDLTPILREPPGRACSVRLSTPDD